jgi:general stress protein 26
MAINDLNKRVKEALGRTEIMALSTIGVDGSWTCPVQYSFDEKLNLFFLSMPDTKHVKNILHDPRVSVAIYKDVSLPDNGNLGLQIKGKAEDITEDKSSKSWHRFKIIPEEIWLFDSRVFDQRQRITMSELT